MDESERLQRFREKPIVIEAEQWFPGKEIEGVRRRAIMGDRGHDMVIETLEGTMQVSHADWIITGIEGEKYPCKDSIFKATYEKVINLGFEN